MQMSNFVTTQWLAENLGKPGIAVVDGSFFLPTQKRNAREEYLVAHIPGAVFFDIDAIADHATDLPHMLPSARQFALEAGALGISDEHTIVVYDSVGLSGAPRVWWTFRVFGGRTVRVLDGGLPKWKADGRPVEAGEVSRASATFRARLNAQAVAGVEDVKAALAGRTVQVVDARSPGRFAGLEPEPRAGLRSGHMPGARNVPVSLLVEDGRLVDAQRIRQAFAAGGVDVTQAVITTCGSGVTAATLWLALESIGHAPRALYDGSWSEWGRPSDLPVQSMQAEPQR
jgi:thiosulfate/3-mercaptopyruvate sulfurtransferase